MKHFLLVLALVTLLIIPASAQIVSYTAPTDEAIWSIDIEAPPGSSGTINMYLSNGDTVTGDWSYSWSITGLTAATTIGSDSGSFGSVLPLNLQMRVWNGDNSTYSRQLKLGAGQYEGVWNTVVQTTIAQSPIVRYQIDADQTISVSNELIPYEEATQKLTAGAPSDVISELFGYMTMLWWIFDALWYWLDLLFIQNLTLTVSLYMAGTMAYAINTSRNIFVFYKTWFKQQRAIFEFIANSFSTVISIITQVLQSIRII